MAGRPQYARIIIEEQLVEKRIDQAVTKLPRLAEMWDGIKWRLARSPEKGQLIEIGSDYYGVKTSSWSPGGVPSITVLYRFDNEYVYIEGSKIDWPGTGESKNQR